MDKDSLEQYGIDYERGMANCMQDAAFYHKILGMFLDDTSFLRAKAAFNERNEADLFSSLHELKGVSGNAALTELYRATVPLVELIRNKQVSFEEIEKPFLAVEQAYAHVCEGINEYLRDQ